MKRLMLIIAAALAVPVIAFAAGVPQPTAVESGAEYVASLQQADGGFHGSSIGQNMDAIIALRAAGYDPAKITSPAGTTPVDFIKAKAPDATQPAEAAKLALGATAAGLNPHNIGGTDVLSAISGAFDASTGRYAADDFSQSIAMLGLACTGESVPGAAVTTLKSAQIQADGGWGFQGASDPDTTAIAVQALIASGTPASDPAVTSAIAYFKGAQLADGGWGYAPASNVDSTAYVVQALLAAGEHPGTYTKGNADPVSYLLSQQQPGGAFTGVSAALAGEQVIPALAGRTFCNAAKTTISHQGAPAKPSITPTPTTSAASTTTPSATATGAGPTVIPGGTRSPGAPSTGSGTMPGGTSTTFVGVAMLLLALSGGIGIASIRRR